MRSIEQKICPECNVSFNCGGECWCNKYPPIMPIVPNNGCYCQQCFHNRMVKLIQVITNDLTPEMTKKIKALPPTAQLIEDIDFTINSQGEKEFTKWYLVRND